MRKSRFTESWIVAILKEGEAGVALSELTRKHGISRAIYFTDDRSTEGCRSLSLSGMKELEAENAKLKRMCADLGTLRLRTQRSKTFCPENCRAVREATGRPEVPTETVSKALGAKGRL
jgi:putative transposase